MLVYGSELSILPATPTLDVLAPVAQWLATKGRTRIEPQELAVQGDRGLADGARLITVGLTANGTDYVAIRYTHPDRFVAGREWITEIGLRRELARFSCSTLLRTDEKSALVGGLIETTRPLVVEMIAHKCRLAADCPGGSAKPLTVEDADAFGFVVLDPNRPYPVLQVSAMQDGTFAVDPHRLAALLIGVADVVQIPPHVDTFALEDRLGPRHSCYHGAVNIVWPPIHAASGTFAPVTRIMAAELLEVRSQGNRVENHLLALVCHRTNSAYARRHLTLEAAHSVSLRHALDEAKATGAKSDAELAELYRRVDHDQQQEIGQLKAQLAANENESAALLEERDSLRATVDSLKQNIAAMSQASKGNTAASLPQDKRKKLVDAISEKFTMSDALTALEACFEERVVILDSAWASAKKAEEFNYPHRAFGLLATLCQEYWEALASGKSDGEARTSLGNAFSARESETVESNRRARALRTFTHDGKPIEMMKHLRIGTKDSIAETWRCHFEWDAANKKIVIGHCGKHLDHR